MKTKNTAIALVTALVIFGIFFSFYGSGILATATRGTSKAITKTFEIRLYIDRACTQPLTSIDWGIITPGQFKTRTFYIKNLSKFPMELSLTSTNWTPATANGPLKLTWDLEGTRLSGNKVTMATLTLTLSSGVNGVEAFNVDIVLSGIT